MVDRQEDEWVERMRSCQDVKEEVDGVTAMTADCFLRLRNLKRDVRLCRWWDVGCSCETRLRRLMKSRLVYC